MPVTQTDFDTDAIDWAAPPRAPIVQWQDPHHAAGYPITALGSVVLACSVVGLGVLAAVLVERIRTEHEPALKPSSFDKLRRRASRMRRA